MLSRADMRCHQAPRRWRGFMRSALSGVDIIYAKIGASNRSVATLFAMEHGLL